MNAVIEQARLLGEAVVASEEYRAMRLAEAEMESDAAAGALRREIAAVQDERRTLAASGDEAALQALSGREDGLRSALNALPSVTKTMQAREAFSQLIERMNRVLEFTVTGGVSNSGGCSGSCAGCRGCGGV